MTTIDHDGAARSALATTWELDLYGLTYARFAQLVVERELRHVGSSSWPTEKTTLEGLLDRALSTFRDQTRRDAVLDLTEAVGEECLAHVQLAHGHVYVLAAARSVDGLASARALLREWYPVTRPDEEQRIGIAFWSLGRHGGRRIARQIEVPTWAEIAGNYPAAVRRRLGALMGEGFEPGLGGRLILWHGEPGTGKTFALRALGWEWRSWCDLHYVTDPETFFGSSPTYMLEVLLADEDDDEGEPERWQLLVLEDTGELLAADAKERTGQGLSRLLNVVDGLIGQGLRVLVLVTTNEPLRRLHAAVSRPGRCAAQVEFTPFTAVEARDWLDRNGRDGPARAATLASLLGQDRAGGLPERRQVGFAAALHPNDPETPDVVSDPARGAL